MDMKSDEEGVNDNVAPHWNSCQSGPQRPSYMGPPDSRSAGALERILELSPYPSGQAITGNEKGGKGYPDGPIRRERHKGE